MTNTSFLIVICLIYILPISSSLLQGQSKAEVTLDFSIEENKEHPYAAYFQKQNEAYFEWLYHINKTNEREFWKDHQSKRLLKNSGGNNSLIFNLKYKDGRSIQDTVRNSLHQEDYVKPRDFLGLRKFIGMFRSKKALKHLQIEGKLPEGCMSFVSMNRRGLKCGVQLSDHTSNVSIELSREGKIIATLVQDQLKKGWNNFEWKRGNHKRGKYSLIITVDDQTMRQIVRL